MLNINCMYTKGEEKPWSSSVYRQNTACLGCHSISDKYYRYWYNQNRAWENSFQIPGKGGGEHTSQTLLFFLLRKQSCDHRLISKDHETTKENCLPMANMMRGKEGARVASWLCCFLPATANEIPCQGGTCHTSSTSKGVWRIFYCLWVPCCLGLPRKATSESPHDPQKSPIALWGAWKLIKPIIKPLFCCFTNACILTAVCRFIREWSGSSGPS